MLKERAAPVPAPTGPLAPAERPKSRFVAFVLAPRTARWTSRILLIVIWQLAAGMSDRLPTPLSTAQFIWEEFRRPINPFQPWGILSNQLVYNLWVSLQHAGEAIAIVVVIGLPIGYAMGRWWRAQAFFSDGVTVGLALPAYIWALLAVMWFGYGWRAAVFTAVVSATPGLIVHVMQGSLSIPRDLRDMSGAYRVRFTQQTRNLILPSMAGALIAGIRLAITAAWGCIVLVEWFGSNEGAGFRARYFYDNADYDALMGWGVIILAVVITIDRGIIDRIDRRVHRWRGSIGGFGSGSKAT
jgi:NitT/TauT family transport system permease protein